MHSAARWALDRPLRLAGVAAATVAAAVVLGMCSANDSGPRAGADAKPAPTSAPSPGPSPTPPSPAPAPADVDTTDPAAVATAYITAWAAGQSLSDPDQWSRWYAHAALYCSDRCAATLASVDPARVPATRVTGDARVTYDRDTHHEVAVPTDAGDVSVRLVRDAPTDPWRVESWEQGAQAEPGR